jgi:hypothetical protein
MHPKMEHPISQEVLHNSALMMGNGKERRFPYKRNPATPE